MAFIFCMVGMGDGVSVGARVGCGEAVSEDTGVFVPVGSGVAGGTGLNVQALPSIKDIIIGTQRRRWRSLKVIRMGLL